VRTGQLKAKPRNDAEIGRLLARLADAQLAGASPEGRFTSAYNAAHAASLTALRWHGYRSESRFMVFQCLSHTVNLEVEESAIKELGAPTAELIADAAKLVQTPKSKP
jgi:hypothetical protein